MKIAFSTYDKAFDFPGGGEVILLKCKEYLEKKGHKVKIFTEWDDEIKSYPILHQFGIVKSCLPLVQKAKRNGIAVALHTIYWPQNELATKGDFNSVERIKKVLYSVVADRYVKKMINLTDIIFPNSNTEMKLLAKLYNIPKSKLHVVHDGVDQRFFHADKTEFVKKFRMDNFVLYVGRIEPRKNLLGLIRALKNTEIPLVIIGNLDNAHIDYFMNCMQHAKGNIVYIGGMKHESSLLSSAYSAASVLVLPSWYETPGLVALEAAASGTNIVITDRGCTEEYFLDHAQYIDPSDETGIRKAIEKIYKKKKNLELKKLIQNKYTWKIVTDELLFGYFKMNWMIRHGI